MDNYDYIMNLNTRAVLVLTQLALPYLIKSQGEIVMVSSVAGLNTAGITLPYYCMSKSALDQLMRALATKYIDQGVRVNSVNPGLITTTIMQKQGATADQQSKVLISHMNFYVIIVIFKKEAYLTSDWKLIPARRAGSPRDVAEAIAFLADRRLSSYVVGHTLVVDGGSSIVNPLLVNYTIDK
uniref:Dehydrogenase/reductase SDR family member 11 n=1 Tax=Heterorhabditis bacteriophora TaxID=37862 RepID=A0A1I7XNX2_HETBA